MFFCLRSRSRRAKLKFRSSYRERTVPSQFLRGIICRRRLLRPLCLRSLICFWLISGSVGWIWMWTGNIAIMIASVSLTLCLVISFFCYTKIHLKLRHQQQNTVPRGQTNGRGIPKNRARYKKSVSSILWVQLALFACYVPWSILALLSVVGIAHYVARIIIDTLFYLNSSLNPILYCLKIKELRQAVKATIKQFDC